MSLEKLTCDTIGELAGGQAREMVDAALRKASFDVSDRGEDGKPRKVTIDLVMTKVKGNIAIEVFAQAVLPKYRSDATIVSEKADAGGETLLLFQTFNPEAPDQGTFPEMEVDEDDEGTV
jgi:hypothetical protein